MTGRLAATAAIGSKAIRYREILTVRHFNPPARAGGLKWRTVRISRYLIALLPIAAVAASLPVIPGDSSRGAQIFEKEQCIHCHAVNGRGGKVGIDLGRAVPRHYTPAYLASTMWNHAPVMWSAMEQAGIETPKLSPESAADLFAYFYSARFFEKPGN